MKVKIARLQKELKTEEPKSRIAKKENQALVNEMESNKNVLAMINDELEAFPFDSSQESVLTKSKNDLEHKLKGIQSKIEELERSVHGMEFSYSDPTPNFDRSKVKGLVANLISIPKAHIGKATALEVCAGGKLYQVIVESQQVATQLIQNGKLRRRVTIIPLNKISAFKVQAERITTAKRLAPGDVDLALSLIGSDDELAQAMNYVFGSTLICKDPSVAKLVTFDKNVNLRSVTYDGDVYDPSGQLTGGARSQTSGILLKMQSLREFQNEKQQVEKDFKKACAALNEFEKNKQLFFALKQKKELKEHEFQLLQNRMNNNPHFKVIQHVEEMLAQHLASKDALKSATERLESANERIQKIEKEMNEFSNNRESKLKSMQVHLD